jgi:hypothetical protein
MFRLSIQTKHLALQYFSILAQKKAIKISSCGLVLFMCLYLAAKFTGECPDELTSYKCAMVDSKIGRGNALTLEKFIVNGLGWKCAYVTSSEILDLLFITFFNETCIDLKQKAIIIIDFCLTGNLPFLI